MTEGHGNPPLSPDLEIDDIAPLDGSLKDRGTTEFLQNLHFNLTVQNLIGLFVDGRGRPENGRPTTPSILYDQHLRLDIDPEFW